MTESTYLSFPLPPIIKKWNFIKSILSKSNIVLLKLADSYHFVALLLLTKMELLPESHVSSIRIWVYVKSCLCNIPFFKKIACLAQLFFNFVKKIVMRSTYLSFPLPPINKKWKFIKPIVSKSYIVLLKLPHSCLFVILLLLIEKKFLPEDHASPFRISIDFNGP